MTGYVAANRGTSVDQPRNLAKSVTVEKPAAGTYAASARDLVPDRPPGSPQTRLSSPPGAGRRIGSCLPMLDQSAVLLTNVNEI
jgi:hypothetical protein